MNLPSLLIVGGMCITWPALAADYFVRASGRDENSGTAPDQAWRSIERVNQFKFSPGDRLMFRGGESFAGIVRLDAADSGTAEKPVVISSFGAGRATLQAGRLAGLVAQNVSGLVISNLTIAGAGLEANQGDGIQFRNDLRDGHRLPFVRVSDVTVHGFGGSGLVFAGFSGGFSDVEIVRSSFHDNRMTGVFFAGLRPSVHQDIRIRGCRVFNNPGDPKYLKNSGSGILLGNVNGGLVEYCVAYNNGSASKTTEGPEGIWAYNSSRVMIQHNESHHNHTGGPADGGGFGFDQNVSDSILQYNYSHDNDGAGYLLAHAPDNDSFRRNVVRFNVSENDGRKNSYAGIDLWGRVADSQIYHNTVFAKASSSGTPKALRIFNDGIPDRDVRDVLIANNILMTAGAVPLVEISKDQLVGAKNIRFRGNNYHSTTREFSIRWAGQRFSSLEAWRESTGQEIRDGIAIGMSVDPKLSSPGKGGLLSDLNRPGDLKAYRLKDSSPMRNAALNLQTLFSVDRGASDYFGTDLSSITDGNIGADQRGAGGAR